MQLLLLLVLLNPVLDNSLEGNLLLLAFEHSLHGVDPGVVHMDFVQLPLFLAIVRILVLS